MKHLATGILLALAATTYAASADAALIVIDFNGVGDAQPVGNYYEATKGVVFDGFNACEAPGGSCSVVINEPSPPKVGEIGNVPANATMTVAGGFDTGFSLWYTNVFVDDAYFKVLDGDGNVLATVSLPVTLEGPSGTPYANWAAAGTAFAGIAKSVVFYGGLEADLVSFDNLTLGSQDPVGTPGNSDVPEPLTLSLFGAGLAGMAASRRRNSKR